MLHPCTFSCIFCVCIVFWTDKEYGIQFSWYRKWIGKIFLHDFATDENKLEGMPLKVLRWVSLHWTKYSCITNACLGYMKLFAVKWAHICYPPECKCTLQKMHWKSQWICSTNFLNESSTKCLVEKSMYFPTHSVRIPMFDMFPVFNFNSLPFTLPDVGHRASVSQTYKIYTSKQSNAPVLIAKCKIFF